MIVIHLFMLLYNEELLHKYIQNYFHTLNFLFKLMVDITIIIKISGRDH